MRLSRFIEANSKLILEEFEQFARSHTMAGATTDMRLLREHAAGMLMAIAMDIDEPQTGAEQRLKARGDAPVALGTPDSAAERHGEDRIDGGFSLDEIVSEYRALRASVLRMWIADAPQLDREDLDDLIRFNEGVDQALAESIAGFPAY